MGSGRGLRRGVMALALLGGLLLTPLMSPPVLAAGTTCTTTTTGTTTCTTTGSTGAVTGTCTVTGATQCTPAAATAGGAVSGNLQTIQQELTPNVGAIFANPVTAPLVKLGLLVLDCIAIYLLGSALIALMFKVHEQSKGEGIAHKSLHGSLFAVGVLLLIVAGGGIWLLTGAVAGLQGLLHG